MVKNHRLPAFRKSGQQFIALVEENGYELDRVNSKGIAFYSKPDMPDVKVGPSMTDASLRQETQKFCRLLGIETEKDKAKRNPAQIRDRQAREREQAALEVERITADRAVLVAERERLLLAFDVTSVAEANRAIAEIERADRELRYWRALMTETPGSGDHRVAHRA